LTAALFLAGFWVDGGGCRLADESFLLTTELDLVARADPPGAGFFLLVEPATDAFFLIDGPACFLLAVTAVEVVAGWTVCDSSVS
jgi:hypothetical protein